MSRSVLGRKGPGHSDPQKQADVGPGGEACSQRGEESRQGSEEP